MRDFNHVFKGYGHEGERSGAEDGEDDVDCDFGAGLGCPGEGEVGQGNDGDLDFDGEEVGFLLVDDGRGDGCCDEADDDEQGAGDAGLGFGVGVGLEKLVDEGGEGVEEGDVEDEWDHDHEKFGGFGEGAKGWEDILLGCVGRGGGWSGWFSWEEEGWDRSDGCL